MKSLDCYSPEYHRCFISLLWRITSNYDARSQTKEKKNGPHQTALKTSQTTSSSTNQNNSRRTMTQRLRARKESVLTLRGGPVGVSTTSVWSLLSLLVLGAAITSAATVNPVTPSTRPVAYLIPDMPYHQQLTDFTCGDASLQMVCLLHLLLLVTPNNTD